MFDKIKDLIISKNNNKDSKKKIENLVVFILILIITIIAINTIWNGDKKEETKIESTYDKKLATTEVNTSNLNNNETSLENNLESILSTMEGIGKVKVLITYSQSSEVIAMYNESNKTTSTEETDSRGTEQEK